MDIKEADDVEQKGGSGGGPGVTEAAAIGADTYATTGDENIVRDGPMVLHGWKLRFSILGLSLALFLSALEMTIVATSLLKISEAFHSYNKAGWIVVSYMLTYTGFLVIIAKLSDIFGKKLMMLLSLFIFILFSVACGVAQTITQLIVLRAFQGIGGAGIYSMVSAIVPVIVSVRDLAKYLTIISGVFVVSSTLGPLLGGAITDKADWRWVFWLNGPLGAIAFLIILFSFPTGREQGKQAASGPTAVGAEGVVRVLTSHYRFQPQIDFTTIFPRKSFSRVDLGGTVLSLTFSILLVFAMQQGGIEYPWSSATVVVTLTISVICFLLFILWEEFIVGDRRGSLPRWLLDFGFMPAEACEPIFPMRLAKHRVIGCLLSTGFLTGFPILAPLFNIPQRLQMVNQLSATAAGIRLLPLVLSSSCATAIVGIFLKIIGKGNTRVVWYMMVTGSCLQLAGITLLGTAIGTQKEVLPQQYVYESVLGCGVGFVVASIVILCRVEVAETDMSVIMGAIVQVRMLGGCIALALCTALLYSHLKHDLAAIMNEKEVASLLKSTQSLKELGEERMNTVREVFAEGYALQMRAMVGFAAAAVMTALGSWKREWKVLEGMA